MKVLRFTPIIALWCTVCLSQDFEIFVSDAGNFNNPPWQILKYDADGNNSQVFTTTNLGWPQDILFLEDQNVVLISNLNTNQVNRHNADTGEFIDVFASDVSGPTRMKIGPDNLLYVLQWTGSGRVKRYQLDGTPLGDFTAVGITQSIGLDWDTSGNLYVSSFNQTSVRRFDGSGNDLGLFINSNLQGPTNIQFRDNGELLVLDWSGGAIRRFDSNGSFLGNFATGLSQPEGIAHLPNGNLLIGNGGGGSVREYDPSGNLISDVIASGVGGLLQPNAVVLRQISQGSDFLINAGLNDAWFNAETPGQGFLITVFPEGGTVFVAWFTFDTQRPATDDAILGGSGQRWLTAQGPFEQNIANLTIFKTTGGVFNASEPPAMTGLEGDGTLTIEFTDCNNAIIRYEITSAGVSGEIPITRIASDNIALCEAMQ